MPPEHVATNLLTQMTDVCIDRTIVSNAGPAQRLLGQRFTCLYFSRVAHQLLENTLLGAGQRDQPRTNVRLEALDVERQRANVVPRLRIARTRNNSSRGLNGFGK